MSSNDGFNPVTCVQLPGVFANPDGVCVQKGFVDSAPYNQFGPIGCPIERVTEVDLSGYVSNSAGSVRKSWASGVSSPVASVGFCPSASTNFVVPGVNCYFR